MAASVDSSAWLEWITTLMGGVSPQSHAATFPPDLFYCLLDDLPIHLLPRWKSREPERSRERLFLNPDCSLHVAPAVPQELESQRELLSEFALQGTIAWVRGEGNSWLPFWLGPELAQLVSIVRPADPVPSSVPNRERLLLQDAGIFVSETAILRQRDEWDQRIERSGAMFRSKGYATLRGLIHPFHIAALRRYYRYRIRTGKIALGDGQSPRRYVAYNDAIACFFHRQLTASLSAVAGEALKPSYVYLASYLEGADLKKHVDREQCEFSISLCLDFSPETDLATPWPIHLDTPKGTVTVYQALCDGLAYRGTRLPHYRRRLQKGQTSTSIFFHYVDVNFAGSLS